MRYNKFRSQDKTDPSDTLFELFQGCCFTELFSCLAQLCHPGPEHPPRTTPASKIWVRYIGILWLSVICNHLSNPDIWNRKSRNLLVGNRITRNTPTLQYHRIIDILSSFQDNSNTKNEIFSLVWATLTFHCFKRLCHIALTLKATENNILFDQL